MSYLFAAFSVVWLCLFLYNFYLIRRTEKLKADLEHLREFTSSQK